MSVDGGNTATYTYDALNRRVETQTGGSATGFVFNINGQRSTMWDLNSQVEIEGKVYWGSMPLVFYASHQAYFEHPDWIGTERLRTSYSGAVEGIFTSLPFGDGYGVATGADIDQYHFAGLDTDGESTTSHAQFRQYTPAQGRWMSPDPYSGSYDLSNPQSLNRYSYVLNNPLTYVDPSGLSCVTLPTLPDPTIMDNGDGLGCEATGVLPSTNNPCASNGEVCATADPSGDPVVDVPEPILGVGGSSSVISVAPSNGAPTASQCASAVLQKDGVALGLDVAGDALAFVPGGGLALAGAQMGVAVASTVNSAVNRDTTGSMAGIAGFQVAPIAPAAEYVGASWAKAVPIVGAAVSVFSTVHDAIGAYGDYQSCMAGH